MHNLSAYLFMYTGNPLDGEQWQLETGTELAFSCIGIGDGIATIRNSNVSLW